MSGLDYERAVLAGGPLGHHAGLPGCGASPTSTSGKQFGQAIGEFQLMQGKLADMYSTMNACRAYVYAVAHACSGRNAIRKDAAGAILYAAEKATWMALEAIQMPGRQRLHQRVPHRPAAARRQALRDRRRHQRDPADADRPGAVQRNGRPEMGEGCEQQGPDDQTSLQLP